MKSKIYLVAIAVLILSVGTWYVCSSLFDDQDAMAVAPDNVEPGNLTADDQKAITMAREALGFGNRSAKFTVDRNTEGVTAVFVEYSPPVPGGHAIVLIDKDGQVARILRGK